MKSHVILQELKSGQNHELDLPCVIGRSSSADFFLADPAVSHRHALIFEENEQIWIEDLKSSNGVYVNDEKIAFRVSLQTGDFVQLGQTKFIISSEERKFSEQTIVLHSVDSKSESQLDRQRLKLIYEIATQLSGSQDLTALAEKLSLRFKEIFKQDRGYVALFGEDGSLKPIISSGSAETVPISRSIVKRLFQNGESFLLADAMSDTALREEESVLDLKIRSALCVPLIYHGQIYGLIYLDRNVPGAYNHEDLDFLRTIASLLAPLIENARLWSELKGHYAKVLETLRETQARLIETEREAAYVRLAQAMAHEIRNPLTAIGGLVRRLAKPDSDGSDGTKLQAILSSVERVEMVLREVDSFVKFPPPQRSLTRIDTLIRDQIEDQRPEWERNHLKLAFSVQTIHVMIPLDSDLFAKALSLIFREILPTLASGSNLGIVIQDYGKDLEIVFGERDMSRPLHEPFSPELQRKPWSSTLFLSMAHKIVSDHGGKLLLDPEAHSALPIIIRMPKAIKV